MPSNLRQQKRERTRRALQEAAFRLFHERGFDQVSAADIASAAGVSTRTFFRYFSTKDEVIFSRFSWDIARLRELVRTHAVVDLDGAGAVLLDYSEHLDHYRDELLRRYSLILASRQLDMRRLELQQILSHDLAEELAAVVGADEPDLHHELLAAGIVTILSVASERWCRDGGRQSITEVVVASLEAIRGSADAGTGAPGALLPRR